MQLPRATRLVVRIAGERMYLWRAVDHEGEVLDMLVQRRRDSRAALRLMRKLLKKLGFAPRLLVTDKLRSYASAFRRLRLTCPHEQGLRSRVDDWRGGRRFARLYCFRQLSPCRCRSSHRSSVSSRRSSNWTCRFPASSFHPSHQTFALGRSTRRLGMR